MSHTILQFTDAALGHIKETLDAKDAPSIFRLSVRETGCTGLMYVPEVVNAPKENDVAEKIDETLTVYVDKEAIPAVKGTMIDYVSVSLGQKQLSYDNPNADSLCGCGESFNLKNDHDD